MIIISYLRFEFKFLYSFLIFFHLILVGLYHYICWQTFSFNLILISCFLFGFAYLPIYFSIILNYFFAYHFNFITLKLIYFVINDQFLIVESNLHNFNYKSTISLEFLSFNQFNLIILFTPSLVLFLFPLLYFNSSISHFISIKFLSFLLIFLDFYNLISLGFIKFNIH